MLREKEKMIVSEGQNFYEILELDPSATLQEIETAYHRTKETYSPSSPALYSMFSAEEAQELHSLIEKAYATLTHPDKRKEYDRVLKLKVNIDQTEFSDEKDKSPEKAIKFNGTSLEKEHSIDPDLEDQIKNFSECSGTFLQKVRHYKGITLDELSEFSKISKSNILAIEGEDFDSLPVKVFIRGFVSQLSRLLGLDEKRATESYISLYEERKK